MKEFNVMGYITKSNLSGCCDFGVQMGEYACMFSIGKQIGLEPVFFIEHHLNTVFGLRLTEPFVSQPKVCSTTDIDFNSFVKIPNGHSSLSVLSSNMNYDIVGDAGMYDCYDDMRNDILDLFTFKNEITEKCQDYINSIKTNDEITIGMHFRRGDYLLIAGLKLSLNYYYEAIDYFNEKFKNQKIKYLIFSNDIEWVKGNLKLDNCVYVEGMDRYHDMCLMSLCDHMIIANSTFSFWGAYLNRNPNKTIVCPYAWGNPGMDGKYFPKDWVSLKTY
jgi:hypothetical protein